MVSNTLIRDLLFDNPFTHEWYEASGPLGKLRVARKLMDFLLKTQLDIISIVAAYGRSGVMMCVRFFIQLCLTVLMISPQAANTSSPSKTIYKPFPACNAYTLPDTSPAVPAVS